MSLWNSIKRCFFTDKPTAPAETGPAAVPSAPAPAAPTSQSAPSAHSAPSPQAPRSAAEPQPAAPRPLKVGPAREAASRPAPTPKPKPTVPLPKADWSKVAKILEIGMGDGLRTEAMLAEVLKHRPATDVLFFGIDLFEMRREGVRLPLKQAFSLTRATGVKTKLVPGDIARGVRQLVCQVPAADLVVISAEQSPEQVAETWPHLVHLLHAETAIFLEDSAAEGSKRFRRLTLPEAEALAKAALGRVRRAA